MPFLIFYKKNTFTEKLADNIEFKPANKIKEARQFARKCLGIYKYELTDINCANYVNEALAEYYNKSNNKHSIIDSLIIDNSENNIAAINVLWSSLVINQIIQKVWRRDAINKYKLYGGLH